MPKKTTAFIRSLKNVRPVVCITAYDAIIAKLASEAGVDLILIGDSVGTTLLGHETTVPVTLDAMLHHTKAVSRVKPEALVVADLPFLEGHLRGNDLFRAAARLMQEGGAEAVKLEGGVSVAGEVADLVSRGVPVLGHIGLLPQNYHVLGGYRKFGKVESEKELLMQDALALQEAGAFGIVAEMVEKELAGSIAKKLDIPLIGIGSGNECDGQVLVSCDLLGLTPGYIPSFVKKYADLKTTVAEAFSAYVTDVQERKSN